MNRAQDRAAKKRKKDWQTQAAKTNKLKKERDTDINKLFDDNMENVVKPVFNAIFGAVFYLMSMAVIPITVFCKPGLKVLGVIGLIIYVLLTAIYTFYFNKYKKYNKELHLTANNRKWITFSNHLTTLGYVATAIGYIFFLIPGDGSELSLPSFDMAAGLTLVTIAFAAYFIAFVYFDFYKKPKH